MPTVPVARRFPTGRGVPLARRNLFADRRRALLATGGVAVALLLVLVLGGIFAGAMRQLTGYIDRSGADLVVSQLGVTTMHMSASVLRPDIADRVRETPGVAWAEPIRSTTGMVSSPDGRAVTYVIGYDPAARHGGPSRLVAGLPPRSGEAVVDRQAADQLGVAVGQQVHVLGEPFTVTGLSTDGTNIANTTVFIPPATSPGCVAPPKAMCWSAPSPASTSACFPSGGCCVWTPPPRSGGPHEHPDRDRPHRPGRGPARHRAHQDLRPG